MAYTPLPGPAHTPLYMPDIDPEEHPKDYRPARLAIAMSGSGSNAVKIIERYLDRIDPGEDAPGGARGLSPAYEPVVLFTDNPDSNARHIGSHLFKDRHLEIPVDTYDIRAFYADQGCENMKDMGVRALYDMHFADLVKKMKIDIIALAGYDWALTPNFFQATQDILKVNVHPGDLRVRKENGEPAYRGLAWVPNFKAIMAGEHYVHTSVHEVVEEVDKGQVLAVSAPVEVPRKVTELGLSPALRPALRLMLNNGYTLKDTLKGVNAHPEREDYQHAWRYPMFGAAKELQEQLKEAGDWVIFPQTLENIALGRYSRDEEGVLHFDGMPFPNGVEF